MANEVTGRAAISRVQRVSGTKTRLSRVAALAATLLLLQACSGTPPTAEQSLVTGTQVTQRTELSLPFPEAVAELGAALVANAQLGAPDTDGRYPLIVDPWVDRVSGNQVEATRSIESQLGALVSARYPQIKLLPFNTASLKQQPLILLGAVAPEDNGGSVSQVSSTVPQASAYRVWGVIGDLRTGRIVSRASVRAQAAGVSTRPAAFFRDSPAWMPDQSIQSYYRSIDGEIGGTLDPTYLQSIQAAAFINDGIRAYETGRYDEALTAYTQARQSPLGEQSRVYNGLYLANQALGRTQQAADALGHVIRLGLLSQRLALKFVFRPGSNLFWPDPAVSGAYPMWLREIAEQTAASNTCLELTGHTSATGSSDGNQRLSLRRANYVRDRLVALSPSLRQRIRTRGAGSTAVLVGTGTDDASDLLDRRVEFQPVACPGVPAMSATQSL
ncbi:OmpA family protein [Roseomonas elaeocarpi]|uniref:OmpA family protein n=1 Tax=Roseomonas elaeocarpi TaxID=907779 RepID=A0ABV6JMW2_9PROT